MILKTAFNVHKTRLRSPLFIMHQNKPDYTQGFKLFASVDYDSDDLIAFQLDSEEINFSYSQFVKYSKHFRENYAFSDTANKLPQEIHKFREEYKISLDNIVYFFQLLKQDFSINENTKLTYIQCIDLLKMSKYFEVRKLSDLMNAYVKESRNDVDFILQMIQYEIRTQNENEEIDIRPEMEDLLISKVHEFLSNKKFSELPIPIIYRIIKKSLPNVDCDKIFDFIKKSIDKLYVLFSFIDLEKISNDRLEELCDIYSKSDESNQHYFNYLKCSLNKIDSMNKNTKNLEIQLKSFEKINQDQQDQLNQLETIINQIQEQLEESLKEKNEIEEENKALQNKIKETEKEKTEIEKEKKQFKKKLINKLEEILKEKNKIEEENKIRQNRIKITEKEKTQLQKQLEESEKIKNKLQKQLEELLCKIDGKIIARVKNGLIVNAQISLNSNGQSLDTTKSKYIISNSDAKELGNNFYEKGEPITSLQMNTNEFVCKAGTYYIRCLVFDKLGKSREIVSNPVTTSGKSVSFLYEGKPNEISLLKGIYMLEAWGSKGGDSDGMRDGLSQPGKGGLGGYSRGILTLNETQKAYIYVGGEGKSGNLQEGATTDGGFPDGGGTKTGHFNGNWKTAPGTGGGSSSIRLGSKSDYSRVIVAGGGGGAGGSYCATDNGGFGGGLTGGNCMFNNSHTNKGSGTQTGSTCGLGSGSDGDPGRFGFGATGKYHTEGDSGGGGGGGWYGGGSGGHGIPGYSSSSSGGGGSGWTFTEQCFKAWQSGDLNNSSQFLLNSSYYLTDAVTIDGDKEFPKPEGNGTECGHSGNGYVKITPQ